ncbi:MAG: hypothetical protein AB3N63_10275 [Puniceicoccaceae bacterium]
MIPIAAIKYIIVAAVMVLSIFTGLRFIFANDVRREAWRNYLKRYVYVSQKRFKRISIVIGWLLLLFGLYVAYSQIVDLMGN